MEWMRDKSAKILLVKFTVLWCAGLMCIMALCCFMVGQTKDLLLLHDLRTADYLLQQGVAEGIVAAALLEKDGMNEYAYRTADSVSPGEQLLNRIGYSNQTAARFIPMVRALAQNGVAVFVTMILLFGGVMLLLLIQYLKERERLYLRAEGVILDYAKGDFSRRLPGEEEGTLYRLFSAVDSLATALRARGEEENRGREFLKNTISDVSHQLKTPLAAMSMYIEILNQEPDQVNTVVLFTRKAEEALGRMEGLIRALLKITRLDAGSIAFESELYTIGSLAEQAIRDLQMRAEKEEKQIITEGDRCLGLICDRDWTCEAIGNLIKNALDHTGCKGHVWIRWELSPVMVRLFVRDDGCGIGPEDIHHIFKRFYRSSREGDRKGIGLGLPLARAIAEGQGGSLSVTSIPGEGSTFVLCFPAERCCLTKL